MANDIGKLGLPGSFCFAPYTNLDLNQDGKFYPCYRSKERQGSWKDADVVDEYNNQSMQQLRDDLWNGRENANCIQCHRREAEGVTSTRQQYNQNVIENIIEDLDFVERIKENHKLGDIQELHTMEIRPHGMCTNACAHCDENSSSKWIQMQDIDNTPFLKNYEDKPEVLDNLYSQATNLKTVHFTGGEPLLYEKTHLKHLENIPNKENIELRYHSSLKTMPSENMMEMWEKFKKVKMFVSLDTSKMFYAYFRWGSNWDTVVENIEAIRHIVDIRGTITVNLLTMLDFAEIVNYLVDNNIPMHVAFVDPPHQLSCVFLPDKLKSKGVNQMNQARLKIKSYDESWKTRQAEKWINEIQAFMMSHYSSPQWHPETVKLFGVLDQVYGMLIKRFSKDLDFDKPL